MNDIWTWETQFCHLPVLQPRTEIINISESHLFAHIMRLLMTTSLLIQPPAIWLIAFGILLNLCHQTLTLFLYLFYNDSFIEYTYTLHTHCLYTLENQNWQTQLGTQYFILFRINQFTSKMYFFSPQVSFTLLVTSQELNWTGTLCFLPDLPSPIFYSTSYFTEKKLKETRREPTSSKTSGQSPW